MEHERSLPHSQEPTTCPILSMPSSSFPKIHINIIFPSTPESFMRFHSLMFTYKNPACNSSPMCATFPANRFRFYIRIINSEGCTTLSSSLCSLLHSPVSSCLLGLNIQSTLYSNTLSQRSLPPFG